jgi:cell division protein FtsL
MAVAVALSALLVGGPLGVVAVKAQQVRLSYRLDALRVARADLENVNRELRVELASLRAPERVERAARAIGMTAPVRDQVQLAREYMPGRPDVVRAAVRTGAGVPGAGGEPSDRRAAGAGVPGIRGEPGTSSGEARVR